MVWLYRLQQRLALTRIERNALLILCALLLLGLIARHLQQTSDPAAAYAEAYAEDQRLLESGTQSIAEAAPDTSNSAPDTPATRPSPPPAADPPALSVNINTATAAELEQLPRIGPAIAARIIDYREAHGAFGHVEELQRVRGIGPKTLTRLRPHVRLD